MIADMVAAVASIATGRIALEVEGQEQDGMLNFKEGCKAADALYRTAMASSDCELMLIAEYTYLKQEREYAEDDQSAAESSAAAALAAFDDAFLALQAVEDSTMYKGVELAFPHRGNWRYNGYPNDAFHSACTAHKTRITNGLTRFGVNRKDRELAKRRIELFDAAQSVYLSKQKKALGSGVLER